MKTKLTKLLLLLVFVSNGLPSFGQDTLILKSRKRNMPLDTAIVKVLYVEELEQIEYIPYEKFSFTIADSIAVSKKRRINKRGQITKAWQDILAIKYDEKQKDIIFFNRDIPIRKEKNIEYFKKRNIISGGLVLLAFGNYRPGKFLSRYVDYEKSEFPNGDNILAIQPSFEHIFCRGALGIKLTPVLIGVTHQFVGTGLGVRGYPIMQLPTSYFFGFDLTFANSTRYRNIAPNVPAPKTDAQNEEKQIWHSIKRNRNELLVAPLVFGFAFTLDKNYYVSVEGAGGAQIMLSERNFLYEGNPYKYGAPVFGQARLAIGANINNTRRNDTNS